MTPTFASSANPVAMKWSATGTVTNLGFGDWTRATAVSNGGSTLAGWQGSTARDGYRWTAGNGKTSLGGMGVPLASRYDQPTDITPDGSVIVGNGRTQATSTTRAFRWRRHRHRFRPQTRQQQPAGHQGFRRQR